MSYKQLQRLAKLLALVGFILGIVVILAFPNLSEFVEISAVTQTAILWQMVGCLVVMILLVISSLTIDTKLEKRFWIPTNEEIKV